MSSNPSKPVLIWLITGAIMVAAMVIIGGITRLTNSGLSMVEWKLIMGSVPPLSTEEWQATFEKYQQFPEYQEINAHYTLDDFKSIFWWEYSHRLLGRLIGIVFLVPFIIFWIKGYFTRQWLWRLGLLFALGGLQGFLGWFMVKSGLVDNPDVSHYRLAIHLLAAFILFLYIIWLIMDVVHPERENINVNGWPSKLRILLFVTLIQVMFGAFVAGLNAGLFYPTFPTMNGEWLPSAIADQFAANGYLSIVSDITTIQFIHRWLGIFIFSWIFALYIQYYPSLLSRGKRLFGLLMVIVSTQATLGILALLLSVPILIAVLHQIVALALLTAIIINLHAARSWRPQPAKKTGKCLLPSGFGQ
jgi:heme a synthase